jgi:hypothetical protein
MLLTKEMFKRGSTNKQLIQMASMMSIELNNVLFKDQFDVENVYIGRYILNLASSGSQGTHWCAFYKINEDQTLYMDPYGIIAPETLQDLFRKEKEDDTVFYNTLQIQDYHSKLCGLFCLLFLYVITHDQGNVTNRIKYFNSLFNTKSKKDLVLNDDLVLYYVNGILGYLDDEEEEDNEN